MILSDTLQATINGTVAAVFSGFLLACAIILATLRPGHLGLGLNPLWRYPMAALIAVIPIAYIVDASNRSSVAIIIAGLVEAVTAHRQG